jgi:hypothetical protein
VNRVFVLRVLPLPPFLCGSIHHFEIVLIRSFCAEMN